MNSGVASTAGAASKFLIAMNAHLPAAGAALFVSPSGQVEFDRRWDPRHPGALLPGSFNPLHAGHRGLAAIAEEVLGVPVAYELSIANVDKAILASSVVQRRVRQFAGSALWLTHAPRFVQKADLFPGAVFVVGADTAVRIVDPRYYDGDLAHLYAALGRFRERGCRFLVACRVDPAGQCIEPANLPVPDPLRDLFMSIPSDRFRLDISSTALRARESNAG